MEIQGVRALQRTMESGESTAASIVRDCIDRIEKMDRGAQGLSAILEMNPDALEIAEALDRERAQGTLRGPLHGIPVLLKANIDTGDQMATTAGSLALADHRATKDAPHVERLRAAGAIVLGKANLSEWANFRGARSVSGWSSLGGQTRNPHDRLRSPCGSSSGSAAAVVAGYAPISIGTETDGSIVCPAQTCGVVGIKPTLGLVSRTGIIPIAHSQDTAGPMANSVEDAALLLSAIAGNDPLDPATAEIPKELSFDFAAALKREGLEGARLGVVRSYFGKHPGIDRIIEQQLIHLRELGATLVDPVEIKTAGKWHDEELLVLLYEFKHDLNVYLGQRDQHATVRSLQDVIEFNKAHSEETMPHFGQELMEQAQEKGDLSSQEYLDALAICRQRSRDEGIDATLQEHGLDALVAPSGGPGWLIDQVLGDLHLGGCSSPAAVAGYPHITIPAGKLRGLPVGLSFFSTAWQEAKLIRYAYAYEQALREASERSG